MQTPQKVGPKNKPEIRESQTFNIDTLTLKGSKNSQKRLYTQMSTQMSSIDVKGMAGPLKKIISVIS
jgi:hypothetical protein